MSEYMITVFSASAAVALCGFAFYGRRLEATARVALGIILVSAIISPLISIGRELLAIDVDKGEFVGSSAVGETAEDAFCRGVRSALAAELSVSADDIDVKCRGFSAEKMKAEKITVTLYGSAALADHSALRRFVSGNNLGECEVRIGFE